MDRLHISLVACHDRYINDSEICIHREFRTNDDAEICRLPDFIKSAYGIDYEETDVDPNYTTIVWEKSSPIAEFMISIYEKYSQIDLNI